MQDGFGGSHRVIDFHFGFSSTIRRPSYVNLAGVWIINETNLTVTTPNPGLKPETSTSSEIFAPRVKMLPNRFVSTEVRPKPVRSRSPTSADRADRCRR